MRNILLIIFITIAFCGCQSNDEIVIGIAWRDDVKGNSYLGTYKAIEAIGAKPVLLGQVRSTDLEYIDGKIDGQHLDSTFSAFTAVQPVFCIFSGSFLALTIPTKSDATIVSRVAKATVNSLQRARFSVVACVPMQIMISLASHCPPQAAFMAFGVPSALYVPMISTGCGSTHGFCPKLFIFCSL